MPSRLSLPALSLGCAVLALGGPALADTLKKPALDQLAARWQAGQTAKDFNAFLAQAVAANPANKELAAACWFRSRL